MGKTSQVQICSFDPDDQLVFRFEPNRHIPVSLAMKNLTNKKVAFKVKTTNPKKYCVRPSSGLVDGKGSRDITVTLNAQKTTPGNFQNCRDKFLIQATVVGSSVNTVTSELFDDAAKKDELQQTKLRVQMLPPAHPPSPVPEEGTQGDETLQMSTPLSTGPRVTFADQQYQQQQQYRHEMQQRGGAATTSGGFGVLYILCVALLAFMLGYFSRGSIPSLDMAKDTVVKLVWGPSKGSSVMKLVSKYLTG